MFCKRKKKITEQTSMGVSVGVYHGFKDICTKTEASGQTASQKLDGSGDRCRQRKSAAGELMLTLEGLHQQIHDYENEKVVRLYFPRLNPWTVPAMHYFFFLR